MQCESENRKPAASGVGNCVFGGVGDEATVSWVFARMKVKIGFKLHDAEYSRLVMKGRGARNDGWGQDTPGTGPLASG